MKKYQVHVHDIFYKDFFCHKHYGLELLKLVLTPSQFDLFDWHTLRSEMETLITKEGRERRTDLIFSVRPKGERKGQRAKIIFLVEHKAQKDNNLLFQLLEYQALMYAKEAMPIIPIVFYHGKVKGLKQSLKFHDVLKGFSPSLRKKFGKHILSFEPILLNIHDFDIGRQTKTLPLAPVLFVLQRIWNLNESTVKKLFTLGKHLSFEERKWQMEKAVDYIRRFDPKFTWELIRLIEEKVIKEEEERVMPPLLRTLDEVREEGIEKGIEKGIERGMEKGIEKGMEKGIEQGIERGMEEGIEKGIKEGIEKGMERGVRKVTLKMLENGLSVDIIRQSTGLSIEEIDKIKKTVL